MNNLMLKKSSIFLLLLGATTFLQGSITEPGKKLLTPKEVFLRIGDFKKSIDEKGKDVADMEKAKGLLKEAYEALYLCDIYTFDDLHIWINNYQSWSRDPMRYRNWEENRLKEKPNVPIGEGEYYITCLEEGKKIREHCKDCHLLRPQLFKEIDDLSSFFKDSITGQEKLLLTPKEVLSKISDFKKYIDKKSEDSLVPIINKEYVADMEEAEKLLIEAYEALYLCDTSLDAAACEECHSWRPQLFKQINDLSSFVIYRKLRADKETVEFNECMMKDFREMCQQNNEEKN